MSLILQYYSDSYVSSVDKVQRLAKHIHQNLKEEDSLIVIIPGIGEMIDQWLIYANEISNNLPLRNLKMLQNAANQASIAILTIALQEIGISVISLTPSQLGIIPEEQEDKQVYLPKNDRIERHLQDIKVVIIANYFDFISIDNQLDIESINLTKDAQSFVNKLKINYCEIYTDTFGNFINKSSISLLN